MLGGSVWETICDGIATCSTNSTAWRDFHFGAIDGTPDCRLKTGIFEGTLTVIHYTPKFSYGAGPEPLVFVVDNVLMRLG